MEAVEAQDIQNGLAELASQFELGYAYISVQGLEPDSDRGVDSRGLTFTVAAKTHRGVVRWASSKGLFRRGRLWVSPRHWSTVDAKFDIPVDLLYSLALGGESTSRSDLLVKLDWPVEQLLPIRWLSRSGSAFDRTSEDGVQVFLFGGSADQVGSQRLTHMGKFPIHCGSVAAGDAVFRVSIAING